MNCIDCGKRRNESELDPYGTCKTCHNSQLSAWMKTRIENMGDDTDDVSVEVQE